MSGEELWNISFFLNLNVRPFKIITDKFYKLNKNNKPLKTQTKNSLSSFNEVKNVKKGPIYYYLIEQTGTMEVRMPKQL